MTIKWPALRAVCEQHTVDTPRGRMAGFLVRCTSSRRELGYIWAAGSAWRWRTPSGANTGERSSQRAAIEVLRDAFDLANGVRREPRVPVPSSWERLPTDAELGGWRLPKSRPTPRPAPAPSAPEPTPPPQRIVWGDETPDLTAAVAAALRRQGGK